MFFTIALSGESRIKILQFLCKLITFFCIIFKIFPLLLIILEEINYAVRAFILAKQHNASTRSCWILSVKSAPSPRYLRNYSMQAFPYRFLGIVINVDTIFRLYVVLKLNVCHIQRNQFAFIAPD